VVLGEEFDELTGRSLREVGIQLLKDLAPRASRIAVLINPTEKTHQLALQKLPEAGRLLGVELVVVEALKYLKRLEGFGESD